MIPKTIHYCWFGRNPLPQSALKCIESWKRVMPDYEVKEWNEDNFDINMFPYAADAYAAGKYAFVSDVARFWILQKEGGVYFDTDVEAVRPLDDLIDGLGGGGMMGWETPGGDGSFNVNPGLMVAMPAGLPACQEILDGFAKLSYYRPDGTWNGYTMIPMVGDLLQRHGLKMDGTRQTVSGVTIFPADYFCPMDALTGRIVITGNTRSIHRFSMSWMYPWTRLRLRFTRYIRRLLRH